MKTVLGLLSATAIICALAMPAAALPVTWREVDKFNDFLMSHPQVAGDLARDPNLLNNSRYIESHAALRAFLDRHEELREAFQAHPASFMSREGHYWWRYEGPWEEIQPPADWELAHNYGYWDENHVWHDRDWWEHNRPDWVAANHPKWLAAEEGNRERYASQER